MHPYTVTLTKLGQILAILGDCQVEMMPWCRGWGCSPPLIASHIHSGHILNVLAPFNEVRRHISKLLHCYTNKAWLVFSNSWCLSSVNDLGAMGKREQTHWLMYKRFASPLIYFLFYVMIASLLVVAVMWIVWGSASWAACCHSAQLPSHVSGMHPQRTSVGGPAPKM